MHSRHIQPKMETYFNAISALSKGGHGAQASRILDRLDNKDWIMSGESMQLVREGKERQWALSLQTI